MAWTGSGEHIGHTVAAEVNYALHFLENIIYSEQLPKVLIVHQFTQNMLPDKESPLEPVVDLVLDMTVSATSRSSWAPTQW